MWVLPLRVSSTRTRMVVPCKFWRTLLTHKYLHKEIREKGGVYGGGASYSAMDGVFTFYSYRDPNPANSLSAIVQAGEWAVANEWTQRNLDEAKLSIFQGIDAPLSPRSESQVSLFTASPTSCARPAVTRYSVLRLRTLSGLPRST